MDNINMKKKYSFTLDEELMDWFKNYCRKEYTNMSYTLNKYILDLKRFKLELNQLDIKNINYVNKYKYNTLEYLIDKLLSEPT